MYLPDQTVQWLSSPALSKYFYGDNWVYLNQNGSVQLERLQNRNVFKSAISGSIYKTGALEYHGLYS